MTNDIKILLAISTFAFVTSFRPRSNNFLLLEVGLNFGFKRVLPNILGISFSFLIMSLVLGSGFERVFKEVPWAYPFIKVLSLLLLLYLTWRIASTGTFTEKKINQPQVPGFCDGALAQCLSLRAWVITIVFFGNYLPENPSTIFIIISACTFSLMGLMAMSLWTFSGKKITNLLTHHTYQEIFNITMAGLLILSMLPIFNKS